eukprot:m.12412 g.12412  ORF g.12412 m.12412 type:complete len:367 (+) comp8078_c0_seq2:2-1102(+)
MKLFLALVGILVALLGAGYQYIAQPREVSHVPHSTRTLRVLTAGNNTHFGSLKVEEMAIPDLKPGQVLVRVEAAPVNPSDVYHMRGVYQLNPTFPYSAGFEGSGTVIATGGGILGWLVLGKRVSFAIGEGGSFSDYAVTKALQCVPLKDDTAWEQGASGVVNPMTVEAMLQISYNHPAIIHTAAASALGKMLLNVCAHESKPLINIVRRDEQRDLLISLGAKPEHVLVSSHPDFSGRLTRLAARMHATIAFDAVGGELTGQLLNAMPPKAEVYVYGTLSNQNVSGVSPMELLKHDKSVRGLHLATWFKKQTIYSILKHTSRVSGMLNTHYRTEYVSQHGFDTLMKGVEKYVKTSTNGKILLKPSLG